MGTSGNPAKKAASKKVTQKRVEASRQASDVSAFKKRKKGSSLELPSGLVVVARRVELRTFLERGDDVPNPLLEVVEEALNKGSKASPSDMLGVEGKGVDLDMVFEMYEMVNSVVRETVVEPKVHEVPDDEEDRSDDLLYVDEIEDEDKMFLFQWATGGTADLATFREEATAGLAALAQGQGS